MSPRKRTYLDYVKDDFDYTLDENGNYIKLSSEGETSSELYQRIAEDKSRLDSIGNTYQTADKIITGDDITVTISRSPEVFGDTDEQLAKNNGRDVIFNAELIEDLDTSTIVSMNGINYHELSHILFSPRAGSTLGRHVESNDMKRAYNMLEEGRIERLMTAKYPSTRLYLEAMVLDYFFKGEPDTWGNLFPLVTGRRYLDTNLRQTVADKFINSYGATLAQEVSSIINEYAMLSFPEDFNKGIELITRFSDIVGKDGQPPKVEGFPMDSFDMSHNERKVLRQGRPLSNKEQERLQNRQGQGEPEDLSGKNDKDGDKAGFGVGGGNADMDSVDKTYSDTDKEIADKLTERLREIYRDSGIKNEVSNIRKSIIGDDEMRSVLGKASTYYYPCSTNSVSYARRFATELERMVRNNDPKWEREMPVGRLNVSRTMTPNINNIDRVFDRWDLGNPNTDIEAVILLDNSGSMNCHMGEVCEKAWIIKRGIEAIQGNVTVYNFHSWSEVLYSKDEKAKPRTHKYVRSTGSTNPLTALIEAERILLNSNKAIKLLFVVTDGYWDNDNECDEVIKRLNKFNAITAVVFMGEYEHVKDIMSMAKSGDTSAKAHLQMLRHNASIFKAVAEPSDVLELAVEIVKSKVGANG